MESGPQGTDTKFNTSFPEVYLLAAEAETPTELQSKAIREDDAHR